MFIAPISSRTLINTIPSNKILKLRPTINNTEASIFPKPIMGIISLIIIADSNTVMG